MSLNSILFIVLFGGFFLIVPLVKGLVNLYRSYMRSEHPYIAYDYIYGLEIASAIFVWLRENHIPHYDDTDKAQLLFKYKEDIVGFKMRWL